MSADMKHRLCLVAATGGERKEGAPFYPDCPLCVGTMQEGAYISPYHIHGHARGKRPPEPRAFGPICRCGARNTARIGDSALTRQCQACGQTYAYRLKDGLLVPLSLDVALALDAK